MKVALIGYGKMGEMVARLAPQEGIEIIATIDSREEINQETIGEADICIDFSHPEVVLKNIRKIAFLKKSIIMGTTGWYSHLKEVKKVVTENEIGFLYAENFSIGMQLFEQIVAYAAELMQKWPHYEMSLLEEHHRHKQDAPSGTALRLQQVIKQKIPISSHRMGYLPGTHRFQIDSPVDTITLTHTARSREGFALGALKAAKWLHHKQGFFHLKDLL